MHKDLAINKYKKLDLKPIQDEPINVNFYNWNNISDSHYDMHYMTEIGVILEGSMIRDHFGKELLYNKGDVWLVASWEPHGFRLEMVPCTVLVFLADPMFLSQTDMPYMNWLSLFTLSSEERKKANTPDSAIEVLRIAERITGYMEKNEKHKIIFLKNFMTDILLQMVSNIESELTVNNFYLSDVYKTVDSAINLITTTKRFISIEEAASVCNMNRAKFSQLFTEVMGISFAKFGLSHRLSGANKDLLTTNETIENIAADWGFTDSSHFTLSFIKHFGKSPGAQRKRDGILH